MRKRNFTIRKTNQTVGKWFSMKYFNPLNASIALI